MRACVRVCVRVCERERECVCVCVCACGVRGIQYDYILFFRFYVYVLQILYSAMYLPLWVTNGAMEIIIIIIIN